MKFIMLLSILAASVSCFAEDKITFSVTLSPAGSFQAVSKKPKGNLIKENGAFTADKITVSIESFKTGIELRDEHLWKHMQSAKHPKATVSELKAKDGKGTATLEINGIKKSFNLSFVEKGQEVEAKFKLKASDFALPKAEYLGVGVDDIVGVEVTLPYKAR
jgi:hypothetical protein